MPPSRPAEDRSPPYERVLTRVRALVAAGELGPGDRLPSERELAVQLGVSRNSLRPALAALAALGVVEIRHGSGVYLRDTAPEDVASSLAVALVEQNRHLPATMEARMALERFAVGLAAGRRTDADLADLDAALETMAADLDAGGSGAVGDERFHDAVCAAAHNPVLLGLQRQLADQVRRIRDESLAQPGRPARSLAAHRRIVAAVRAGDPRAAVAAMDDHLGEVADTLLVAPAS